ncbi:MAG: anthranilate phosphoribosyltransferase [Thermoplasmata archaeon]|nr:anthranilate phosphoribosyltransferase [Thermoplasmata archaeon]
MIGPTLGRLLDADRLSRDDAERTFDRLLDPESDDAERCALIVALTARPADPAEWARLAEEMRRRALPFRPPGAERAVDLCGSGGAPCPSFNVSTASALVVAAAGVPVIKHGNRSARGSSGSSDLLLALGLPVDATVAFPRASFRKFGIAFLHAPLFHPSFAAVAISRRRLGVPTIFNRLGPLANPARPGYQVVGWGDRAEAPIVAAALRLLKVRSGLTMTSAEGCDEFSPQRPTYVRTWRGTRARTITIHPSRFLPRDERTGPWGPLPPAEAANETERLLAGGGGARRGSVLLTAGAALWVTGRTSTFEDGVERSRDLLDEGAPERLLENLRSLAQPFARAVGS